MDGLININCKFIFMLINEVSNRYPTVLIFSPHDLCYGMVKSTVDVINYGLEQCDINHKDEKSLARQWGESLNPYIYIHGKCGYIMAYEEVSSHLT